MHSENFFCEQIFFFLGFLIFRGNFGSFPGSKYIEAQNRGLIRFQVLLVLNLAIQYGYLLLPSYRAVISSRTAM